MRGRSKPNRAQLGFDFFSTPDQGKKSAKVIKLFGSRPAEKTKQAFQDLVKEAKKLTW